MLSIGFRSNTPNVAPIAPTSSSLANWDRWPATNTPPQEQHPSVLQRCPFPCASFTTFIFLGATHNIKNCSVFGPHFTTFFKVATEPLTPNFTVIRDAHGKNIAAILWKEPTLVEITGTVPRQTTKQWLSHSPSGEYRIMQACGRNYYWFFYDSGIWLYSESSSSEEPLARIVETGDSVVLDIAQGALENDLLQICILAAVLFKSGHNLD